MAGANIYGELIRAQAENLGSDPTSAPIGRFFYHTGEGRFKGDNGTVIRSFLRNDDKCVIGTNGTANTNVRFHRGGVGIFQIVLGGDATAEGSLSTSMATLSSQKLSANIVTDYLDYTETTTPANPAANTRRGWVDSSGILYLKTSAGVDRPVNPLTTKGDFLGFSTVPLRVSIGTDGQIPVADAASTPGWKWASAASITGAEPARNFLYNSNFDIWQRGTTVTIANGVSTYQPDRWYGKNSSGTNGVLTLSQTTGVSDGALFGCKLQITTAPTAAQANGCELYQTLDRMTSLQLYNQTACFSVKVKSFGNVNQCGIQFFYKTTEAKVDTSIGAEVTATVNTATFTTITISGQALGTSQTTSGVIGVRIRPTAVSSGNLYDINNGFVVEQAIVNLGTTIATYSTSHKNFGSELQACLRFYEKSYDLTTNPGTATATGSRKYIACVTANTELTTVPFAVRKRAAPTGTYYSTVSGTSGQSRDLTAGADAATTSSNVGETEMGLTVNGTDAHPYAFHYTADAEI